MKSNKTIIVLPRTEPDLDGVACAVAYSELLNRKSILSLPWYKDNPDAEARHLIGLFDDIVYASQTEVQNADKFILVDASGLEGLPKEVNPSMIVEVIDHRFHHNANTLFLNAHLQIEPVGAAATLVLEKFISEKITPSTSSALMLYGAIHSNTQCLKGTITTQRDVDASSWLEANTAIPVTFLDEQFAARRNDLVKDLRASIIQERKEYSYPTGQYAISQLEFHGSGKVLFEQIKEVNMVIESLTPRTALNMVDLESNCSFIFVKDDDLKEIFATKLGLAFKDDTAISNGIILRKQIVDRILGY